MIDPDTPLNVDVLKYYPKDLYNLLKRECSKFNCKYYLKILNSKIGVFIDMGG